MSGNVLQWSFDWHPASVGSGRVTRGSGWGQSASVMQVGFLNNGIAPHITLSYVGLRIARTEPLVVGTKTTFTGSGVDFKMAYVPGGLTFKAATTDATPTKVANAYWIGETHVTYELWRTVKTWATSHSYTFGNPGREGNDGAIGAVDTIAKQEPVTTVNWRDSMVWMNALTEWYNYTNGTAYTCAYYTDAAYTTPIRTSTTSATIDVTTGTQDAPYVKPYATGFRMLSSMEWELAARYKGADSSDGAYEWPAGSGKWWTPGRNASGATAAYTDATATQAVGWNSDNAGGTTHDAKLKRPNALALYDMSGNVLQWNFDWYPGSVGTARVIRGGSWSNTASFMQVGNLNYNNPSTTGAIIGLRFARTY
jgi:formylglycine-generating enzyme